MGKWDIYHTINNVFFNKQKESGRGNGRRIRGRVKEIKKMKKQK